MLSIFSCVCWPYVCLLWRNVYLGLLPIFWFSCLFFCYWIIWAVYIFWKLSLCQSHHLQIFCSSLSTLFMVSFAMQKLLSLIMLHLFALAFISFVLGDMADKSFMFWSTFVYIYLLYLFVCLSICSIYLCIYHLSRCFCFLLFFFLLFTLLLFPPFFFIFLFCDMGLPRCGQEPACQCRRDKRFGLIPGSGKSPGKGNGNPFQYSRLEHPMDRGACWATIHGVAQSRPLLKQLSTRTHDLGIMTSSYWFFFFQLPKVQSILCSSSSLCSSSRLF